ncbi:MAG: hypothetical protein J1G07_02480 [Clostridiales bacterium]|nr:hypothetical protein [Clostridiales bacterium]
MGLADKLDINKFADISFELYRNKFTSELTEKEKQDIAQFMAYLVSVPSQLNDEFCEFLFQGIQLYSVIASILFASMNNIKKFDITAKYQILKKESKYTLKPLNVLNAICDIYDIKIVEKIRLFGKDKVQLEFPKGFRARIAKESLSLPNEIKITDKSLSNAYDDFVNWWSSCDEDEISCNEILFGAYQIMWFYNEVCNGGFDQFWDFAENSEWDFNQMQRTFKKMLPADFYVLFDKAFKEHLKGKDCENFNSDFDYDKMENEILPQIAKTVMDIINQKDN